MDDDPNHRGGSRRWILRACDDSLRRLGTDYIDLYQMHRPDPRTDIDETLGALDDLVHQGKVRSIGSSTFPPSASWKHSGRRRVARPSASSASSRRIRSSPARWSTRCCPPASATAWVSSRGARSTAAGSPASTDATTEIPEGSRLARLAKTNPLYVTESPTNQRKLDLVDQLAKLASDAGMSLIDLALAFVLQHPAVTAAIIGPRTMQQLEDQLGAADVTITADVLDRIDELTPPGTDVDARDAYFQAPAIVHAKLRRR